MHCVRLRLNGTIWFAGLWLLFLGCNKVSTIDGVRKMETRTEHSEHICCERLNPRRTGVSPYVGPEDPIVKWEFATDVGVYGCIYDEEGRPYACDAISGFYALDRDGNVRWKKDSTTGMELGSYYQPCIYGTRIFFADKKANILYCISLNGDILWQKTPPIERTYSPLTVDAHGNVYLRDSRGSLCSFSKDGRLNWTTRMDFIDLHDRAPAIDDEGNIYLPCFDRLLALTQDGRLKWSVRLTAKAGIDCHSPVVGTEFVYVGKDEARLRKISPSTGAAESIRIQTTAVSSPLALGDDGTFFCFEHNKLYAIDEKGHIKWSVALNNRITDSCKPVLDKEGRIFVGTCGQGQNKMFCIDGTGKIKWGLEVKGGVCTDPVISPDGTLYFGTTHAGSDTGQHGGVLYAVGQKNGK